MQNLLDDTLQEKAGQIVQAAVEAIYRKGLDQVKLTDVAKQAGVTTGAVTYYFEDKDALLTAAFHWSCMAHLQEMKAASGAGVLEPFLVALPTTSKRRRLWSVWLAFSMRAQTSREMQRIYREHYQAAELTIAGIINDEHPEQALSTAGTVLAAMDGIGLCATLNPQQWPADRQRSAMLELLEPILSATG